MKLFQNCLILSFLFLIISCGSKDTAFNGACTISITPFTVTDSGSVRYTISNVERGDQLISVSYKIIGGKDTSADLTPPIYALFWESLVVPKQLVSFTAHCQKISAIDSLAASIVVRDRKGDIVYAKEDYCN
jgi:hypothetical protein